MAYVAPASMAALTDLTAQDWISTHLQPNDAQMEHLFQHVYGDLNQVLTICRLSNRQKYAVLRQGVTCIEEVRMLGSSVQTIRDTFNHFNSLTDAGGGTNFGAIHYTRIHALTEYVRDGQRRHGQVPDVAGFTNAVMEGYIGKSEVTDTSADSLEVAEPLKLGENNFHQWEDAILAQLRAKKGNNDVPLAYVVRKPTPQPNMQMKPSVSSTRQFGLVQRGKKTRRRLVIISLACWRKHLL